MKRPVPDFLKRRLAELPQRPGVYLFKDAAGKAVYIGKALCLKKRVAGHFSHFGEASSKEGVMLDAVRRVDIVETPTEAEALLLEASLVKEQLPKYNAMLRDDKSYPYLKVTGEEFPRLLITRQRRSDGSRYFGPYTDGRVLRQAVHMLRREFPLRTCRKMPKKVCLQYHLGLCGGPCEGHQEKNAYAAASRELVQFLDGRRDALVRNLSKRMREYAEARQYEKAQAMRDAVRALAAMPVSARSSQPVTAVLEELRKIFALADLPRRIECFDISNIQGKEPVGSMVVFAEGEPLRSDYRHFRVKTVPGIDDYRMMREVVRRRYAGSLASELPLPDLVLIDGGKGHLAAAKMEMEEIGFHRPVLSIAKQHEHLFAPDREAAYVLPPTSRALQLFRHLRDEAHRFAIGHHRRLHRREAMVSALDGIPGLGEKGKQKLLKKFGTLARIKQATEEDLVGAGLRRPLAANLRRHL
jgi:excinuclease ABC subunit C